MTAPADVALRADLHSLLDPDALARYVPAAPPGEVSATRHQFVDFAAYVRRWAPGRLVEVLRAARVTEWHMARRWPANPDGVNRSDDRPPLGTTRGADSVAWQAVYEVGRCDLEWLLDDRRSAGELTQTQTRSHVRAANPPPPPTGRPDDSGVLFPVLYADPPWRYEHSISDSRDIENQYPTMPLDEIAALTVPAAPDAVLFCWATSPKLHEAFTVLDGWGFNYRTGMVWVKDRIGMGYWVRQQHEHLLIATRGQMRPPEPADRPASVVTAPRGEHSAKPPIFYELIDRMYPAAPKVELFARTRRPGWAAWGNEVAA